MIYGLDFLGIARYGKVARDEFPQNWTLGAFSFVDGFGDALPAIDGVLATGRVSVCRLQLAWDDDHKFSRSDRERIKKEAERCVKLVDKYPNVKWYFSPCCEHELREADWEYIASGVLNAIGNRQVLLVNSPNVRKGFVSRKHLNEYHGADKRPRAGGRYAFSFDGTNCVDADVESYKRNYKDAEYFLYWSCQANGRLKAEDKTPRPKRKAWPTSRQIDSWIYLSNAKGATKFSELYKSHSDQHTVPPSGKDQKPVFIIKAKVSEIVLKTRNGQIIDRARFYGSFTGGGYRYYCTDWGYLLAEKAKRIQGDPLCDVFVNGKKVGVINPGFRDGKYR
jgi:hypothetical protein